MTCRFLIGTFFSLLVTSAVLRSCYKEGLLQDPETWPIEDRVLEIDHIFAFCDKEEHLLLYPLPADTLRDFSPFIGFGAYESIEFNGHLLQENTANNLGEVRINHPYAVKARSGKRVEDYQLYFTSLPLIHIHTHSGIRDEPKVLSWLEVVSPTGEAAYRETHLHEGFAGVEIRGRTSATHEKKSYGLELWENADAEDRSASLLGMREGEDWILDAMYVDPLRMRNKISFEIWEKLWAVKQELPFLTTNPGIQGEYVELFINQRYRGLYCLTERLDERLINLDGAPEDAGAALYKAIDWNGGATSFSTYNSEPGASMVWEGWEQVYPDQAAYWDPLAELRKAVVYDSDAVFKERIGTLLNLEVAADYYLFTNLILAHDNIVKNYFLARYAGESRFLLLPWDLEGSWGIMWDGDPSSSNGLLKNRLYDRLKELDAGGFNHLLEEGWEEYRASIFQQDSLSAPFERDVGQLLASGAIDRENRRWPGVNISLAEELEYFMQWTTRRLTYLDQVFD
jgi:hypothetical protein